MGTSRHNGGAGGPGPTTRTVLNELQLTYRPTKSKLGPVACFRCFAGLKARRWRYQLHLRGWSRRYRNISEGPGKTQAMRTVAIGRVTVSLPYGAKYPSISRITCVGFVT
jgi:hypothetical protein